MLLGSLEINISLARCGEHKRTRFCDKVVQGGSLWWYVTETVCHVTSHVAHVRCIAFNHLARVVSIDEKGMIEYWKAKTVPFQRNA